jgi:hypothetical protein
MAAGATALLTLTPTDSRDYGSSFGSALFLLRPSRTTCALRRYVPPMTMRRAIRTTRLPGRRTSSPSHRRSRTPPASCELLDPLRRDLGETQLPELRFDEPLPRVLVRLRGRTGDRLDVYVPPLVVKLIEGALPRSGIPSSPRRRLRLLSASKSRASLRVLKIRPLFFPPSRQGTLKQGPSLRSLRDGAQPFGANHRCTAPRSRGMEAG